MHVFSDMHMQCPANWYNGYKDGRIQRAGAGERVFSDLVTGDPVSSTFTYRLSDYDTLLRQALASTDFRYWIDPVTVHMTTIANRALLGEAYPVFVGPIIDAQPVRPLSWEITLGDLVSQRAMTDRGSHPWRKIGDGFLDQLSAISPVLDLATPEPIIYGVHRRIRAVHEASQHGFEVDVTDHYLGIWDIGGGDKHVWLLCQGAISDIPDVNVVSPDGVHTNVNAEEGNEWLFPHFPGWATFFGGLPYVDLVSSTFGNLRRYSLILGVVGAANPDACAFASGGYPMDPEPEIPLRLMVCVDGIEPVGDGSGTVIRERALQYLHWAENYGTRSGLESYQSGLWLGAPTITLARPDGTPYTVSAVDEGSFAAVAIINAIRFPTDGADPPFAGWHGAAIIGAKAGEIHPVTKWISDWNRSTFVCQGWTNTGQFRIATPHPTEAVKELAPLVTDAYEMRQGSFNTVVRWPDQANTIPFQCDPDYVTDRYWTIDSISAADSVANYGREIIGAVRELPFCPGITMATQVAYLHSLIFRHPPRYVVFEDTVGPDYNGESLGYLKLGQYVKYRHYAAVGSPGQERLAWVIRHQVQAGTRRALVECWDMEDLKGFDATPEVAAGGNDTCETALVITNGPDEPFAVTMDTTAHGTDADVAGIADLPGPAIGYHAAHFSYTPPVSGVLFLTTVHSQYDTQIAVCTGACGSLVLVEGGYNDDDGVMKTSVLEVGVAGGVAHDIIVYGYGPDDGGPLTFGLLLTAS